MSRTKRELQEELELAKNTLEKQKVQLDVCKQEREKAALEIETLEEERARMVLKVKNIKPLENKGEIKKLKATLIDLRKKLDKSESMDKYLELPSEGDLPSEERRVGNAS